MNNLKPEELQAEEKRAKELEKELRQLNAKIFGNSRDGKRWFQIMTDALLLQNPTAHPDRPESHAFFREGQNSILRNIMVAIREEKKEVEHG